MSLDELNAAATALGQLNDASSRLWRLSGLPEGLEEILRSGIELVHADMGNIQLYSRTDRTLRIAAHHGFAPAFLDFFREVTTNDGSACGRSLRSGERVIIPDVDADAAYASFREVARDAGYRGVQSTPLIARDGSVLGVLSTHWRRPHQPGESDLRRLDWYVRQAADFIDRCRREEALRDSEAKYHTLFHSMDEGFCIIEFLDGPHGPLSDYVHVEANPAYARHAGIPNVVGQRLREMVPDEADDWIARYRPVLVTGEPIRFQQDLVATGRRLDLAAFRVEPPQRRQVAVLFTDITARWQAEVALRASEEKLQAANDRKDEFLAMLAHELRNPLAPIRNAVEVLKMTRPDEPRAERARDIVERQTLHLTRLIDDLLDVSRITQGKVALKRQRLTLAAVVDRAVEASRPFIEARGVELTIASPSEPLAIDGDPVRLVQVVSNLLNNAAKYSDEGGRISVELSKITDADGEHAALIVRDHGIGIPAESLPYVFDLFTQGEPSLDRSQGGLGIGLTVVRHLVGLHGGRVEARSGGPGQGSEFTVRLPLETRSSDASGAAAAEAETAPARATALRILVVEDNQDSAEILGVMLQLDGHETHTARDGAEALDAARALQPHVILCDIGLPVMNGYEFAARLREDPAFKGTCLVALTGYGQQEDQRRARESGFDHHLTKPVEPASLEGLLSAIATGARTVNRPHEQR
jgi:signal transduction histidine kinase/ActR/RegA family two-component response regulator